MRGVPVSLIKSRLRRLEESKHAGRCPECGLAPHERRPPAVINEARPEMSFDGDPNERCGRCGHPLYTVMRVVYGDEGGRG